MIIGYALTANATRALLLGSGELGKESATSLQRYGIEVIAVDRYQNAPAHHVAHRSYVTNMTDTGAVKNRLHRNGPILLFLKLKRSPLRRWLILKQRGNVQSYPMPELFN
jgi:phosphoribosylglycinamide formyltransferase 2